MKRVHREDQAVHDAPGAGQRASRPPLTPAAEEHNDRRTARNRLPSGPVGAAAGVRSPSERMDRRSGHAGDLHLALPGSRPRRQDRAHALT